MTEHPVTETRDSHVVDLADAMLAVAVQAANRDEPLIFQDLARVALEHIERDWVRKDAGQESVTPVDDDLTPRDVIANALDRQEVDDEGNANYWAVPDALVAALIAAGWRITRESGEREFGVRLPDGSVGSQGNSEGWCQDYVERAAMNGRRGRQVVRRSVYRSPWEVVPDVE